MTTTTGSRRYPNGNEKRQESKNRYTCLTIAKQYFNGEIDYSDAISNLKGIKCYGNFIAGEISLEQARRASTESPTKVTTYIELALFYYKESIKNSYRENGIHSGTRLASKMKIAQIELFKILLCKHKIPNSSAIASAYKKLLNAAQRTLVAEPTIQQNKNLQFNESFGFLGEIAILALLQRHDLQEMRASITNENVLSISSFLSEDHKLDVVAQNRPPWDITRFTQYDRTSCPDPTYRIQVKCSIRHGEIPSDEVTTVNIVPDLKLSRNEKPFEIFTGSTSGCLTEIENPNAIDSSGKPIQVKLDARTDMLLEILD